MKKARIFFFLSFVCFFALSNQTYAQASESDKLSEVVEQTIHPQDDPAWNNLTPAQQQLILSKFNAEKSMLSAVKKAAQPDQAESIKTGSKGRLWKNLTPAEREARMAKMQALMNQKFKSFGR